MSLIVHGRASSSNVQTVMWATAELGLSVDRRDVGGKFGGNDDPAYRAINPMGVVPSLEDGDLKMFESSAILRSLVGSYNDGTFAHTPRTDMWAEWSKHTLSREFLVPVFWGYYRTPAPERDMDTVMAALRRYEGYLALALERRVDDTWIFADRINLADIWLGHLLYRYFTIGLPLEVPEGAQDYYDMLCAREAYRTHVMIDYSELKGRPRA